MDTPSPGSPAVTSAAGSPQETRWQRWAAYLVARRVRVSVVVFVALIVEDVVLGVQPHDIFDYRDPRSLVGCALIFAGLAVRSWAAGLLCKTRALATAGPYALVRNPLYLGSFLIMIGFCILIDDAANLYVVLGPLFGLYVLQIMHEERTLQQRHPEAWSRYIAAVPRFFPRRIRREVVAPWHFAIWRNNREYRALGAVLVGMLALDLWRVLSLARA